MKKIFLTILSLILVLGLTGCYSEEEVAQMKDWEANGISLLSEHLENKYGLTDVEFEDTKVHKIDPGPIPDFSPDYVPYVSTYFVVDGIRYFAAVEVEYNSLDHCYDNYEHELIINEFEKYIKSAIGENKYSIDLEIFDDIESEFYVYNNPDYYDGGYDLVNKKFTTIEEFVKYAWDGENNWTKINGGAYVNGLDEIIISDENQAIMSNFSDFKVVNFKDFEASMYFVGSEYAKIENHIQNITDYYQFGKYLEYMNDRYAYNEFVGYQKVDIKENEYFKYWNKSGEELKIADSQFDIEHICDFYEFSPNTVVYLSPEKLENLDDGQIYIVIGITQMGHNEYSSKNLDHLRKSDIITIGDNSFIMVEFDRIGNYDYWTIIPKEDISADKNQSNAEENTNLEDASNTQ